MAFHVKRKILPLHVDIVLAGIVVYKIPASIPLVNGVCFKLDWEKGALSFLLSGFPY